MTARLDASSRDILEFRPNIFFTEPDQEPGTITGQDTLQFEDVKAGRDRIKKLAQAVNQLALATQARVDQRAKDIAIRLDLNLDQDAIQAMRRRFPDADPNRITYRQYRECKNGIIGRGIEIGDQAIINKSDIRRARDILQESGQFNPGQFGTEAAKDGSFRPELSEFARIIPPIPLQEMQADLICILVNHIWKNFILPALKGAVGGPLSPVSPFVEALPDELCNPGSIIDIPGLQLLGEPPDDLLSGQQASEVFSEAAQGFQEVITQAVTQEL